METPNKNLVAQLNDREQEFVRNIIAGHAPARAILLSGYSPNGAESAGWRLMRKPQILAAIHAGVTQALVEGAPLALKVVRDIIEDPTAHPKIRLDASKIWLDRAGHIAPRARAQDDGAGRSLHEMTIEELQDTRGRLENEIQSRARLVNAPVEPVAPSDAADLLG